MSNNPVQYRRLRPLLEDPATTARRASYMNPVPASLMYAGDPNQAKFKKSTFQVPSLHPARAGNPFRSPRIITTPGSISGTARGLPTQSNYLSPAEKERLLRQYKMNQVIDKGLEKIGNVVPYASNILNSFRRAPSPAAPTLLKPVTFGRVNYGASRAEAEQQVYGANQNLNMLGENQAVAVRTANLSKGLKEINRINEAETNQNTQLGIQEAQTNAQIDAQNTALLNAYEDSKVNQRMAEIQQRSANLANAADKFIGIGNQKSLMELEKDKYAILQQFYKPDGVLERFTKPMAINPKTGLPTYEKSRFGGKLKYSAGGMLRRVYGDPVPKPIAGPVGPSYHVKDYAGPVQTEADSIQYKMWYDLAMNDPETARKMIKTPPYGMFKDREVPSAAAQHSWSVRKSAIPEGLDDLQKRRLQSVYRLHKFPEK